MAEAQAAPAVAEAAPAQTETVTAPAETTEAKPAAAPKKKGAARHDEIRAKLTETVAVATKTDDKPAAKVEATDAKPPETKAEEKPKPAVGAVMRLTAENTKLKGQLEELQGKLTASSKGETLESLRERVKKDPAAILDVFGEDLDPDENNRLTKLNDAVLARLDPSYREQKDRDDRVAKLEKELADRDAAAAERASKDRDDRAASQTGKLLTEGFKGDDGAQLLDPAKYPYINHLTKSGEVDAHRGVMLAVREMAADFRKVKSRDPNDAEIVGFIGIAADQAETYFTKRSKNWQPPQAAAPEPQTPKTPTTIGSGMGVRAPSAPSHSQLSKDQKHEAIRQKLRAQAQTN